MTGNRRQWRQAVAVRLAADHGGVVNRADLLEAGVGRNEIKTELARGVWHRAGTHTLSIDGTEPQGAGSLWRALWESGPRAVLDGASALVAAGLTDWATGVADVTVPGNATVRRVEGVRHHVLRDLGPHIGVGLRRTKPAVAAVRAAEWARTDREAAALIAMTVQQRLVSPGQLHARWNEVRRSRRRELLDAVVVDVCDGAQSINELDVGAACRSRGLPPPSRQAVRQAGRSRHYLDLFWDDAGVHVEVHGAHHYAGLMVVADSRRQNALAIDDPSVITLQIPVLGWRLSPETFLDQIEAALQEGRRRRGVPDPAPRIRVQAGSPAPQLPLGSAAPAEDGAAPT